jgi:3-carboxy-cis,cis-muconate cycloisomerase
MSDVAGENPADWGLLEPLRSATGTDDDAILAALVEVEAALTLSFVDARYAPAWVEEIAEVLAAPIDKAALARGNRSGGNPVIPLVTALRQQAEDFRAGGGEWVHRGATSQDILDTALMLVASRAIRALLADLDTAANTLAALADAHRTTLQAGRTLTQHAAPITFGIKAAGWLDGLEAALDGLAALKLPVQLAGAVGTGAAFIDLTGDDNANRTLRAGLAARLDLADPGRSWQAERSPVAQLGSVLGVTLGVLGRISSDILVLARTEIGELIAGTGGSSAMPQKQNPTVAVLIRAAALRSPGLVSSLFASLLSADERPDGAWHASWQPTRQLLALTREAASAATGLLAGLSVDAERMASNLALTDGLIFAEQALSLMTRDNGRDAATAVIAEAVTDAVAGSRPFADAVPVALSVEPTLRLSHAIVDAALARHRSRQHNDDPRAPEQEPDS